MAKNLGTVIFFTWFLIPIVTLVILFCIDAVVSAWYVMLAWTLIVYFISFIAGAFVRKWSGRGVFKNGKDFWRKMLVIVLKSVGFAIGLTAVIYMLITDNVVFYTIDYPQMTFDIRYVAIAIIMGIIMVLISNISIKGE